MAEYIEREAILESIAEKHGSRNDVEEKAALDIWDNIKKLPPADVVEVKHGCWVRQKGSSEAICSECKREVVYQIIDNKWWFENYCPHCGAKMDLEEGADNDRT